MNDSGWEYVQPKACVSINGFLTYDMDLFFKVQDMRMLYKWEKSMEFLAICELASGSFPSCKRDDF